MNFLDKIKQKIWNIIYRLFFNKKSIKNKGRKPYHIGWLAPSKTLEDLKIHLHAEWGFGNHFISQIEDDQVLSWRKLVDSVHQYHLRVFKDGELRGRYEFTPEGHPIDHFREKGEKEAREDFLKFLGEFYTEEKYMSKLEMDPNTFDPKFEILRNNN